MVVLEENLSSVVSKSKESPASIRVRDRATTITNSDHDRDRIDATVPYSHIGSRIEAYVSIYGNNDRSILAPQVDIMVRPLSETAAPWGVGAIEGHDSNETRTYPCQIRAFNGLCCQVWKRPHVMGCGWVGDRVSMMVMACCAGERLDSRRRLHIQHGRGGALRRDQVEDKKTQVLLVLEAFPRCDYPVSMCMR